MALDTGRRLGPYEIVAPLGAGGMGEVYLARDTRLGREVAVKVLPQEVAADPERRARFEREARAVAALSHPHVCALYDVGRADGPDGPLEYLVMERLEGETLARRIGRGPLPTAQLLEVGRQIAEALGAAHRRGIVHRDLKPGNVMLMKSGAKLLDFGLARQGAPDAEAGDTASNSLAETASAPLTREGTLVGTWPYLSPEQLLSGAADARSDIFALGAVLYEMASGRRAFAGSTPAEVSAAILREDPPDLRLAQPDRPPALATLVQECLARDPATRWQSADDVARALRLVGDSPDGDSAAAGTARGRDGHLRWAALGVALALAAAVGTAAVLLRRGPAPGERLRFTVPPPTGALLPRPNVGPVVAVAPDGHLVAFVAITDGVSSLWLWSAEEGEARRLEGTEGATAPFFSPDGRDLAFFAADELRRIALAGGPPTRIFAAPSGNAGTWSADGTILFTRWIGPQAGLWAVPTTGGEPRLVAPAATMAELRAFPSSLPDGRHYLFLRGAFGGPVGERRACVASLDGGEPDCFTACDSQSTYVATGHLLCLRGDTLVAQPFDLERLRVAGEAFAVAEDVRWFGPTGAAVFAASADGRLVAHEPAARPSRLVWVDRDGRRLGTLGEPARYGRVELTLDGRRAGVEIWSRETGGRDLWSIDAVSGIATRLTFEPVDANSVVWSPDGSRVAFGQAHQGPPDVVALALASGQIEPLLRAPGVQLPRDWSPDGRMLAVEDYLSSRRDQRQLWLLSLSDGQRHRFRDTPANVYHPRFSPDGRSLAFVSEESGRPEVYVASVDGAAPPRRLSRSGGLVPRWRGDGRELFFFQPDGMMVSVDPRVDASTPQLLFHVDGVIATDFDYYAAPDGQRFLVRLAPEPEGSTGLRLAIHWTAAEGTPPPTGRP